jgi:hypothetical protein
MGPDPVGGDCGDVRDALAGESGKAAHGVEDGSGGVGGLGHLAGEPSTPARALLRAAPARGAWRDARRPPTSVQAQAFIGTVKGWGQPTPQAPRSVRGR